MIVRSSPEGRITRPTNVYTLTYTADGEKLALTVTELTNNVWEELYTHYYLPNFEVREDDIEAVYRGEGRLTKTGTALAPASFVYDYNLTDHLGNVRVTFRTADHGSVPTQGDVVGEYHYYPFGMAQRGDWESTVDASQRYRYNGKELNEELGLYEYGARWYDPAVARWTSIDPLADSYASISPYAYVANSPILFIDPDGMRIDFGNSRAEKLYNHLYENSSQEQRDIYDALDASDVIYEISVVSADDNRLGGNVRGATLLGEDSEDDNYTRLDLLIYDGEDTGSAAGQIEALGDELTHAKQFEDGDGGYGNNGDAVSYDLEDEVESRRGGVRAAESCECPADPGSINLINANTREQQQNILRGGGYRFSPSNSREKVVDVLRNPQRVQNLQERGIGRVIYRNNGKTIRKDLK